MAKAEGFRNRILIDGLVINIILIFSAILIVNSLTRPLPNICAFLQKVEAGDLSLRTRETGSVEIQNLSFQLNRMIDRINQLPARDIAERTSTPGSAVLRQGVWVALFQRGRCRRPGGSDPPG